MNTNKKPNCWFRPHDDEVYKEEPLKNLRNDPIGVVVINRCINCGRIKDTKVRTVDTL